MKIEHVYIKEQPGVVMLTSKIEGLLTPERCIEEAEVLLRGKDNLRDGASVDFADSMLLAQETRVHTVVFLINGKEIEVNLDNIRQIKNKFLAKKQNLKVRGNREAIRDAVIELEEKY